MGQPKVDVPGPLAALVADWAEPGCGQEGRSLEKIPWPPVDLSLPQIPSRRQQCRFERHVSPRAWNDRPRLARRVLSPHCSEELAQLSSL